MCNLQNGKQSKKSRLSIKNNKIVEPLKLIYIDLCGNKYILVIVDDFHGLHEFSFLNINLKVQKG